ncbi:Hypothetical protein A7982_07299 [Minicystis rosea]|nr:Hypothetical protein A7982_07299 [Minicystis rosea]
MPPTLSLAQFDVELKRRLLAVPPADLGAAPTKVPEAARAREAIEAWTPVARVHALALLEAIDPAEATLFADRLLGVPEMRGLRWDQEELLDRARSAAAVLRNGISHLPLPALVASIANDRFVLEWTILWEDDRFAFLRAHPELSTPAGTFAALRGVVETVGWDRAFQHEKQNAWGFARWLITWLAREGHAPGAPWMIDVWKKHRDKGFVIDRMLGEAICATRDHDAISAIVETFDRKDESEIAMLAVFALDPRAAFDRLSPRLHADALAGRGEQLARRLLDVIAQDGPAAAGLLGWPSKAPQRWMDADERWAPLLLSLRSHPSLRDKVKDALASVDPAVIAKHKPAPAKRAAPALVITRAGDMAYVPFEQQGASVWLGGGHLVVATSPTTLAIHRADEGLPRVREIALPKGLSMIPLPRDPNESGWDRPGVHSIAIHPDGTRLALGGRTDAHEPKVMVMGLDGSILAEHHAEEESCIHALHWGPAGATLWVGVENAGAYAVIAFDGAKLTPLGRCALGSEFPDPVFVTAHPHPTEDVGLFELACGQDGSWLKCIERRPKLKVRKQKLSSKNDGYPLLGFSRDGALAATTLASKLLLRTWPNMDPHKGKVLGGESRSGTVMGDWVIMAVATVTQAADVLHVYRLPDGERLGEAPFRDDDVILGASGDFFVTIDSKARRVSLWSVALPKAKSARR